MKKQKQLNLTIWITLIITPLFILIGCGNNSAYKKLDAFAKSSLESAKVSEILGGDWDQLCFIGSFNSIEDSTLLEHLKLYVTSFTGLHIPKVFAPTNGMQLIFKKNGVVKSTEWVGMGYDYHGNGCETYSRLYIKKGSDFSDSDNTYYAQFYSIN